MLDKERKIEKAIAKRGEAGNGRRREKKKIEDKREWRKERERMNGKCVLACQTHEGAGAGEWMERVG